MEGIRPDFILELYLQGQTPQAVFIPSSSADRRAISRNPHDPWANPLVPQPDLAQACLPVYDPPSRQESDTEDSNETFGADKAGTAEKEKSHLSQVRSALIIRRSTFNHDVQQYNIFPGEQLTIGRKETCDVVIDHPKVSRYHAAISVLPKGDTYLSITGSKSVTLNETRYAPGQSNNLIYLKKGDEINIVSETFEVAKVSTCHMEATKTVKRELASSTPKLVNPCFPISQVAKKALPSCEWASRGKKTGMYDTPPPPYNSPIPVGINDVSHLHYPTPIKYTFNQTRDPEEDLDEPFAPLRETHSIFHGNSTQTSIPQTGKFQHHFSPPTKINQREMHHDEGERKPMENKKPIFRLDHVQSTWTDTNANFVPRRQPNQSLQGHRGTATVDDRLPLRKSWNKSESGDQRQKKMYVPEGFPSIDVLEHENPLPKSRFQPLTSMVGRNLPSKVDELTRSKKRNKLASGGVPCSPPGNHDVVSLRDHRKNLSQSCSDEDDDPDVIVEGTRLLASNKNY